MTAEFRRVDLPYEQYARYRLYCPDCNLAVEHRANRGIVWRAPDVEPTPRRSQFRSDTAYELTMVADLLSHNPERRARKRQADQQADRVELLIEHTLRREMAHAMGCPHALPDPDPHGPQPPRPREPGFDPWGDPPGSRVLTPELLGVDVSGDRGPEGK